MFFIIKKAPTSVAECLASFSKVVADLRAVGEAHQVLSAEHQARASAHIEACVAASGEAACAHEAADKIESLLFGASK
jgi:hypothetical protein